MLKYTGERHLPWSHDFCTGLEHLHRYALAQEYVKNKKVLDLACGEGYGSNILATHAAHVTGVDICEEVITHAKEKYKQKNISFLTGSMTDVPIKENNLFDVIVCFEAIEHIGNHEELMREVKRLLKPEGIFIVSTPNKMVYSDGGPSNNPFHVKELDFQEFQNLMHSYFKYGNYYGQKIYASSKMYPLADSAQSELVSEYLVKQERQQYEFVHQYEPLPRYYTAVVSDAEIPRSEGTSYLVDISVRNGCVRWEDPDLIQRSLFRRICSKIKRKARASIYNLFSIDENDR